MYSFNEYQADVTHTVTYPNSGENIVYPTLGLAGEVGEVVEKVKKQWRNNSLVSGKDYDEETKDSIVKELGDCLWYIQAIANELNIPLAQVAQINAEKVKDRLNRGVIKSVGDSR